MMRYADLSGFDEVNFDILKVRPLINFKWSNDLNLKKEKEIGIEKQIIDKYRIVLSKEDLNLNETSLKIKCYNNSSTKIKHLKEIYDNGYRVLRLNDSIKLSTLNIKQLDNINIIIDAYNMSERNFKKLSKLTTRPIFFSIGNSKTVSLNKNNANDTQIKVIKELGGVVGINITKEHLTTNIGRYDSFEYIFKHIDYLIELIGADNVCFSAGFSQNSILPWEVSKLSDLKVIENWLKVFYDEEVCEKVMWKNAYKFLQRSI